MTGVLFFLCLWPYLWVDPVGHWVEYLGRTTHRSTINVWYFGHKYADKLVPWHYPFVIFFISVPLLLQVLGVIGLFHPTINTRPEHGTNVSDVRRAANHRDFLLLGW